MVTSFDLKYVVLFQRSLFNSRIRDCIHDLGGLQISICLILDRNPFASPPFSFLSLWFRNNTHPVQFRDSSSLTFH